MVKSTSKSLHNPPIELNLGNTSTLSDEKSSENFLHSQSYLWKADFLDFWLFKIFCTVAKSPTRQASNNSLFSLPMSMLF